MAGTKSGRGISGCAKAPRAKSAKREIVQSANGCELRKSGDNALGRCATVRLTQESGFTSVRSIQSAESAGTKLLRLSANDAGGRRERQRGISRHPFSAG